MIFLGLICLFVTWLFELTERWGVTGNDEYHVCTCMYICTDCTFHTCRSTGWVIRGYKGIGMEEAGGGGETQTDSLRRVRTWWRKTRPGASRFTRDLNVN